MIFRNDFVTVNGAFFDVGTLDTHTVMTDWGDGTIEPATVDLVSQTFSATHQYLMASSSGAAQDIYTITVTVMDKFDSNSKTSDSTTLTVVNNQAPIITSDGGGANAAGWRPLFGQLHRQIEPPALFFLAAYKPLE